MKTFLIKKQFRQMWKVKVQATQFGHLEQCLIRAAFLSFVDILFQFISRFKSSTSNIRLFTAFWSSGRVAAAAGVSLQLVWFWHHSLTWLIHNVFCNVFFTGAAELLALKVLREPPCLLLGSAISSLSLCPPASHFVAKWRVKCAAPSVRGARVELIPPRGSKCHHS